MSQHRMRAWHRRHLAVQTRLLLAVVLSAIWLEVLWAR